jgi:outer membrane protein OmpA-like peptidoglycan-associated protein
VYGGTFGEQLSEESNDGGVDINPLTQQKIEAVKTDQQPAPSNSASSGGEIPDSQIVISSNPEKQLTPEVDGDGKRFLFKIFRANDNSEVEGDVDVIDTERIRKMGTYKGNTPVKISTPDSKSGKLSLICEVFGYRKVQKDVDFNNPQGEQVSLDEAGNVVVPFELARLQKGDIAVMYNVYFFKDAGVMRPESRYEINSLLEMLKENPNYEIKIHGHTNGSAHGKIISMGKDSENYFSLTDTKDGFGSAKKLSDERAHVIYNYLVSNGIDSKRMHVKAWGGKRPIQDKHSTRAQENVRVEIEILED